MHPIFDTTYVDIGSGDIGKILDYLASISHPQSETTSVTHVCYARRHNCRLLGENYKIIFLPTNSASMVRLPVLRTCATHVDIWSAFLSGKWKIESGKLF